MIPDRIQTKINVQADGCWMWTAAVTGDGYGRIWWQGVTDLAHRVVYELLVGPIPPGMTLDHVVCERPGCCNPAHVVPATQRANILRGRGPAAINAAKTHCKHGHEFTEANTYTIPKTGHRMCRSCMRLTRHEQYLRRKERAA